jgi:hypothetical protein
VPATAILAPDLCLSDDLLSVGCITASRTPLFLWKIDNAMLSLRQADQRSKTSAHRSQRTLSADQSVLRQDEAAGKVAAQAGQGGETWPWCHEEGTGSQPAEAAAKC